MLKKIFFITTLLILTTSLLRAQEETRFPEYRGYVNDFANVITSTDERSMETLLLELEEKTTAQIAVVTVSTTQPLVIEEYAVGLFEEWGIGTKEEDNGMLILMAVNDRKVRIETGYGLEGAIPDALASQIVNQIMTPEFKQGNLSKGLLLGSVAVAQLVSKEYNIELTGSAHYAKVVEKLKPAHPAIALLRFIFTIGLFILIFGLRSGLLFYFILGATGRRRGGMWYGSGYHGNGGGFSGGFGGFGGGFSGGGGASGGW